MNTKIAALDIGDRWTGVALSDPTGLIARPHITWPTASLQEQLSSLIAQEKVGIIVVGLPRTMKGGYSEQTNKVTTMAQELQTALPQVQWILWDERLSSKRAQAFQKDFSKEERLRAHAVAAAFILESYLSFRASQQVTDNEP